MTIFYGAESCVIYTCIGIAANIHWNDFTTNTDNLKIASVSLVLELCCKRQDICEKWKTSFQQRFYC